MQRGIRWSLSKSSEASVSKRLLKVTYAVRSAALERLWKKWKFQKWQKVPSILMPFPLRKFHLEFSFFQNFSLERKISFCGWSHIAFTKIAFSLVYFSVSAAEASYLFPLLILLAASSSVTLSTLDFTLTGGLRFSFPFYLKILSDLVRCTFKRLSTCAIVCK